MRGWTGGSQSGNGAVQNAFVLTLVLLWGTVLVGAAAADPPPDMPDCYTFDETDEGLFVYTYSNLPDYPCGAIPVEPGTLQDGDVVEFTVKVTDGQVPNEWGTGSRVGLADAIDYSTFLGVSLKYDDNICYRICFRADTIGDNDYLASVGSTYRVYISYNAGLADLQLVDEDLGQVVHTDQLSYTPSPYDIFQIGLDYPGQVHCGPIHYSWDDLNGKGLFCVDRDMGPYLEGWVDNIYTPGCQPLPDLPAVCYDFNEDDEGLFTYEYGTLPGYQCAAIPVEPATIAEGDYLYFTVSVPEGAVPNEWGTGSRMGLATVTDYSKFLGVSLKYDDNNCYRLCFRADATGDLDLQADLGVEYFVLIWVEGGNAHCEIYNLDAQSAPIYTHVLAYTPSYHDVFQVGLDYPGQAICGPEHFWWDDVAGTANFCVDRDMGPYLNGWVDDVHTPLCDEPDPCPIPDPNFTFDDWDHGLFDYTYESLSDYACAGIPLPGGLLEDGDQFYFEVIVDEGDVPNEWGTGSRIGLTTATDYAHFLGISLVYDDNICYRIRFRADSSGETDFQAEVGRRYGALITYDSGTASLELFDAETCEELHTDALAYTPSFFDVFQCGIDYPGQAFCGPDHYEWDDVSGCIRFCVDRDMGPYLRGCIDNLYVPRSIQDIAGCYLFDEWSNGLYTFEYENLPGYLCGGLPALAGVPVPGDVIEFLLHLEEIQVPGVWGHGTRIGITTPHLYDYFLGVGIAYDDNTCQMRLSSNGRQGQPYTLDAQITYRVHIALEGDYAHLYVLDDTRGEESIVHEDVLPYDAHYFNLFQVGIDYPGPEGTEYYAWNDTDGRVDFRVDRDAGGPYFIRGWIDEVTTPGCEPIDPGPFFQSPIHNDMTAGNFGFEPADMNEDGIEDVVVIHRYEQKVSVWLGDEEGSFSFLESQPTSGDPLMLRICDFNNDGHLDVATDEHSPYVIGIFLGDGTGHLTHAGDTDGGTALNGIVCGDWNEDGNVDLAAMNAITGASLMRIYLGNGDGTFVFLQDYAVGDRPHVYGQQAFDVNLDGHIDLAIGSANGSMVEIFLGDGTGAFALDGSYPQGMFGLAHLQIGHLNDDPYMDMVSTSNNGGGYSVYLGQEDGTFDVTVNQPSGWYRPAGLDIADLDRDGTLDLVVCDYDNDFWTVLEGVGDGTFVELLPRIPLPNAGLPRVADFNNDLVPDLAVSTYNGDDHDLVVYLGTPFDPADVTEDQRRFSRVLWAGPNPLSTATTLRFELPSQQAVTLDIYDATGRLVRQLLRGETPAGEQAVVWDARDERGTRVPNGMYYARLSTNRVALSRALILLRQ